MSPPAEKARSPAPQTTTRVTASSLAQASNCARKRMHHAMGDGIERLRPVEGDEPGRAAAGE